MHLCEMHDLRIGTTQWENEKSGGLGGRAQLPIRRDEVSLRWTMLTPCQGGRQLKAVGGSQCVAIQELIRQFQK